MIGTRSMSVGVIFALIILGTAVSPVHARMGMGGCGSCGDSGLILSQINDIITKYNGNHSGLMQAFSGEFGNMFYILVKGGFMSRSKSVYKAQIDSQGYVTVSEVGSGGGMMGRRGGATGYDCDTSICITTTRDDVNTAYEYLMANPNNYITLSEVSNELSIKLWKTWLLNADLFDDIMTWIVDEYLSVKGG